MTAVAEAAGRAGPGGGRRVAWCRPGPPVQGLAALAVHDPLRRFDDDVIAMAERGRRDPVWASWCRPTAEA